MKARNDQRLVEIQLLQLWTVLKKNGKFDKE